jgi:hypothetical protein
MDFIADFTISYASLLKLKYLLESVLRSNLRKKVHKTRSGEEIPKTKT